MRLAPAVVVHSAGEVREALGPARPVTLVSAPGAALYAGAAWWLALMAVARADHPASAAFENILDCGDAPGRAAEALRLGQRRLVLSGVPPAISARIELMAAALDAEVLPRMPEALDLARPGAGRRLGAWLGGATPPPQGDNEGGIR